MRKSYFIATLILALAAPWTPAQVRVLPDHVGKWTSSPCLPNEPKIIFPATPVSEEAKLKTVHDEVYCSNDAGIRVTAREFDDPTGAYEFYTSELNTGMYPSTAGPGTAVDGNHLMALVGNFVVTISQPKIVSDEDLQVLLKSVKARAATTPYPPVRAFLPKDGIVDGTQRFTRGPAGFRNAISSLGLDEFANLVSEAGFNLNAEAMLARYRDGKDEAVLLLIEYPTPQLAEQHLRHLEQALSPAAKQAGTTIERKASLLSLVLRPSSAAYGNALRSAVNYETEVTWNEPHQTVTDPPLLSTVAKIFIATGVFMVVAVVLGAAFGGVRLLTKIFFPGKVFDRPEQMDVLQLGLSGKRINSRDFY
jgi:hypothetical protein